MSRQTDDIGKKRPKIFVEQGISVVCLYQCSKFEDIIVFVCSIVGLLFHYMTTNL